MSKSPSTLRQALALASFVVVTFCAPLLGVFATPDLWYTALNKPAWNPPSWIFGPVWTSLYLLMAVAAWKDQESLMRHFSGWGMKRLPGTRFMMAAPEILREELVTKL